MINQLNAFRKDCYKEQLQNGIELIEKHQKELENMEKQVYYWKDELNKSQLDQEKVDKLVQETTASLLEFKQKTNVFKNKLLKCKGFYFHSRNFE